jgi:hypothetical protein
MYITAAANAVYRVTAVSSTTIARLSVRQSLQTSVASATASAAGSPAVLTYSNNTNSPVSFYLLVFGPNSGATTSVTVTIDP